MKFKLFIFFILPLLGSSQITFSEQNIDLGTIANAYEISGQLVVKNPTSVKVFLLRADAEAGIKVYTSKKTLLAGDTCLLVISFFPEKKGRFQKKIKLVSSESAKPHQINLSGNILKVETEDKTACYYFGKRTVTPNIKSEEPLIVKDEPIKRDNSNRIPDPSNTAPAPTVIPKQPLPGKETKPPVKNETELSRELYKPNNLLFLVDVSGSMKDSLKLPLMKKALHTLIDAVRDVDSITFITYSDTIKIIKEAISGENKKELHEAVDALKARGLTRGRKAIQTSQQVAQQHFIAGGNNQVFIASDGKFKFEEEDYLKWKKQEGNKKLIISTIAFGTEREAISNLKSIARKGNGSFIHIKNSRGSDEKLLEEIKERSKK